MPDSSRSQSASRKVPAWQVQSGTYSDPDHVFILVDEFDEMGWPKTKLVHRLTPVNPVEQERLKQVRPDWVREDVNDAI